MNLDLESVAAAIREVADTEIMSRFRNLQDSDIHEKNEGDIVTEADLAAEKALAARLAALLPGSLVVGEESVHADPDLMGHLKSEEYVWIIDPVDGTRNFAKGNEGFCVIVALTREGVTEAGWIYQPTNGSMAVALKDQGATIDGTPLKTTATSMEKTRGALHTSYLPKHLRQQMEDAIKGMVSNDPVSSAGLEYIRIAKGQTDVSMFWNTHPWDHAAGALIVTEAGGMVRFKDGIRYHPGLLEKKGILTTGNPKLWQDWCDILFNEAVWGIR